MLKYYIGKLALLLIAGVGVALPMHAEAPLARRGVVRVELQPEAAAKVGRQARVARKGAKLSTGLQSLSATAQKLNAVSMEPVFVSPRLRPSAMPNGASTAGMTSSSTNLSLPRRPWP